MVTFPSVSRHSSDLGFQHPEMLKGSPPGPVLTFPEESFL